LVNEYVVPAIGNSLLSRLTCPFTDNQAVAKTMTSDFLLYIEEMLIQRCLVFTVFLQ